MLLIEKDYRLVKGEGIKCTKTMNAMRSAFDVLLSSFQVYCLLLYHEIRLEKNMRTGYDTHDNAIKLIITH